ncbi:MAG: beta-N-acetylhexosaminidase [Xanthomonadaceae bacterium]|nr:beta-N-acetylhexosaminidase [Xanthomonadaceae bacterium]
MLLIGIPGLELGAADRDAIAHPACSGVILFKRNFASRAQVAALIDAIRDVRPGPFLLAVDQEGGPVQRFQDGFTRLPPLAAIGALWESDRPRALALAEMHAWLMASETRAIGIDLSFAPVVDLARGNRAIGPRAFHADPEATSALSLAYLRGMRMAGMAATIKHFPGHGSVLEDTHFDDAVDPRTLDELRAQDLVPFHDAILAGAEAVMMAHVRYPAVDADPAGYSRRWIVDILRGDLAFRGAVFSDDIGMAAAESAGGIRARIEAHLDAGCDFVLVCQPAQAAEALAAVAHRAPASAATIAALQGLVAQDWDRLVDNPQRDRFIAAVGALDTPPTGTSA